MNKILVSHRQECKTCTIEQIAMDLVANTATLKIKGWAKENVMTVIPINELNYFLAAEPVQSIYGYFSIKIKDEETRLELQKLWAHL